MKKNIFLFCVLLCSSCQKIDEPEHILQADKAIKVFQVTAFNEFGLLPQGSGGAFMDQINSVHLYFSTKEEMDISQMRALIIRLSQKFMNQINSDDEIREYLAEYPFESNRLKLRITIHGSDGRPIMNQEANKEKLTSGSLEKNIIYYSILNEAEPYYQEIFQESFQEALEKVRSQ